MTAPGRKRGLVAGSPGLRWDGLFEVAAAYSPSMTEN